MKKISFIVLSLVLLLTSCAPSTQNQTSNLVGLPGLGLVATMPSGVSSFTITSTGITGGAELFSLGETLAAVPEASFAIYLAGWATYFNGLQSLVEGPPSFTIDGVQYTEENPNQMIVRVVNAQQAEAAAMQMSLEADTDLPGVQASDSPDVRESASTQSQAGSKGDATIVVADDDPADLAAMGTSASFLMRFLGYNPLVVSCLNDFSCIQTGALSGGPGGSQALCVFLDGGFVGMPIPAGAPFPPVSAKTMPGKSYYSGPWIASYLRQLGYTGGVVYVSTEGWQTIKAFKGQGAELGPTYTKGWFFATPTRFAGAISAILPK